MRLLEGSPLTGHREPALRHSSSDSRDTHVPRLLLQSGEGMCATGPTSTAHSQDTQAKAGQAISLKGTPLPLGVLRSSHLLQNQTANRKVKTRQKELFSGFWGKKSLMCWFLSPNHSLKK